jgi:hypothetical protein
MPTPSRPLLQPNNHLLGNVSHDELCHTAINDSTDAVQDIPSSSFRAALREGATPLCFRRAARLQVRP